MRDAERLHDRFGLGLPGEDEANRVGVVALHDFQQLRAVHARHAHVGDHDFAGLGAQRIERRLGAADEGHLPLVALGPKHALQAFEHAWFVVDENDPNRVQAAAPAAESASAFVPPIGRRMVNVVPAPGLLATLMVPPCLSTMTLWAMARPWPVPLPTSLVVKNGSKMRCWMCAGIPTPESL